MVQRYPLDCSAQTQGDFRGDGTGHHQGSRVIWWSYGGTEMTFVGRIYPPKQGEKFWEVRIPELGVFTQGISERDAYAMAADALETLVDQKGFKAEIRSLGGGRFIASASDPTPLVARWLYRLRTESGLSIREVAERLGTKSPEA